VKEIYVLVVGHVVRREETVVEIHRVDSVPLLSVVDADWGGESYPVSRIDMVTASSCTSLSSLDHQIWK